MKRPFPPRGLALVVAVALAAPLPLFAQDPAASRLLREAQRIESTGDLGRAHDEYALLVEQFPSDDLASAALLSVARLRLARRDLLGAKRSIQRLHSEYARTADAASAWLLQAELQLRESHGADDVEEARSILRRIVILFPPESYPVLDARAEARVRAAELDLVLGDAAAARATLLAVVEDEPPGRVTPRATLRLAEVFAADGNWRESLALLQRLPPEGAERERAAARRLTGLVHRRILRPRAGAAPFGPADRLSLPGVSLREPVGVAAASDGRVLVVDRKLDLAVEALPDRSSVISRSLSEVGRPGYTDDGEAFVVADESVYLPFVGDRLEFEDPRAGRAAPVEKMLAADRSALEEWFVVSRSWKSLLGVRTSWTGRELLSSERRDLRDVEVDRLGRVWVLDRDSNEVLRVEPTGRRAQVVVRGDWKRAQALAVDGLGYVAVLDEGRKTVELYGPDGRLAGRVGPTLGSGLDLRDPQDLAVDGSGRIYVADPKLPYVVVIP